MKDDVEALIRMSELYDFYGSLLKDSAKNIFEDYVCNDLSLSEIAENENVSRQGIFDLIKRCGTKLEKYDESLELIKKHKRIEAELEKLRELLAENAVSSELKEKITASLDIIEEEI